MSAHCERLISQLIGAMGQRSMFHRDHPRVRAAVAELTSTLHSMIQESPRQLLFIGVAEQRLVHEGRFLFGSTLLGRKLLQLAERLRSGGFLFKSDVGAQDVLALLDLQAEMRQSVESLAVARERLARGTPRIQLSPPYEDPGWFGHFVFDGVEFAEDDSTSASIGAVKICKQLFDSVETAHEGAGRGGAIDVDATRSLAEELLQSSTAGAHELLRAVRYPDYDSYTVGHSVRVALLAVQVGSSLGLDVRQLVELGTAGLLHDVGKAKIPQEILFKPGRLDEDERRVIAQHPRLGAELLMEQACVGRWSLGAAFGHHLRHDRRGYPVVPKWFALGRATAIVQVCDVFEALTAVRPYKPALSPRRAFEIMLADASAFAPEAFAALARSMGLYPPGSRVLLSNGERAYVLSAGLDIERPTVRVTHDARGAPLPRAEAPVHDLAQERSGELSIVRLLSEPSAKPAADASTGTCC